MFTGTFNFGPFPELETQRLLLREIRWQDVDALYRLFSDEEVTRFNDVTTFRQPHDAEMLFHFLNERYRTRGGLRWAICLRTDPQSRLIGTIGYNIWTRHNRCASVGYDLMQSHWGQGIMPEALARVVGFGMYEMDLNRVEAEVMVGNAASARVLQKLSFTEEGIYRQRGFWKGRFHDLRMFSLLREEYDQQT